MGYKFVRDIKNTLKSIMDIMKRKK